MPDKHVRQEQELAEITTLYEVTKVLASSDDLRDCLNRIMKILADGKGMNHGTVSIVNATTGHLAIEVAYGMTAEAQKRGNLRRVSCPVC